jgi:predicted transcriptional regulator
MREGYPGFNFSSRDHEIMDIMVSLGMSKNTSKVILFLSRTGEAPSKLIENAVDLRQSEVSIVMKWLNENGWISAKSIRKPGKGRPTQLYKMRFSMKRVIKEIEAHKQREIEGIKREINQLKRLAK